MAETLLIENDGMAILHTTYWQSEMERAGKFYLTTNAGAFRLLVPRAHEAALRDMRQAHTCIVSRGPWPDMRLPDALEVLFDDGTEDPWAIHLSPESCDRMPLDEDTEQAWLLTVWTHLVGERCRQALETPCHYRRSRRLPDLRPWHA